MPSSDAVRLMLTLFAFDAADYAITLIFVDTFMTLIRY